MDIGQLTKRRIQFLRINAQTTTLSSVVPDWSNISNQAQREKTQADIAKFLADFEDNYTHLLNNVRVNLPQRLKSVYAALNTFVAIAGSDAAMIEKDSGELQRQVTTTNAAITAAAAQAVRLMRTIVQECNEIIAALRA